MVQNFDMKVSRERSLLLVTVRRRGGDAAWSDCDSKGPSTRASKARLAAIRIHEQSSLQRPHEGIKFAEQRTQLAVDLKLFANHHWCRNHTAMNVDLFCQARGTANKFYAVVKARYSAYIRLNLDDCASANAWWRTLKVHV